MNFPKGILAFDLDGTITPRNQFEIHPDGLALLLNYISEKGYFVIPLTGKPTKYASNIFSVNNLVDRGLIAENAGVFRRPNSQKIEVFGPSIDCMHSLRDDLGIGMNKVNVTNISIDNTTYEVVVDPDDISILTIFTNPKYVTHRWNFRHTIDVNVLKSKIDEIIFYNGWSDNLVVLPPFPDEAIQILRKDPASKKLIDKSLIIENLRQMYSNIDGIPVVFFGDGHNDVPAMQVERVIPITFSNSHQKTIECVNGKNGFVSKYDTPEGLGVVDGLLWLSKNAFFGDDTEYIQDEIRNIFPAI